MLVKMVRGLNFREFGEPVPLGYFVHAWLGPQDPGHEYHLRRQHHDAHGHAILHLSVHGGPGDFCMVVGVVWRPGGGPSVVERPRVRNVIDWLLGRLTRGALRLPA